MLDYKTQPPILYSSTVSPTPHIQRIRLLCFSRKIFRL